MNPKFDPDTGLKKYYKPSYFQDFLKNLRDGNDKLPDFLTVSNYIHHFDYCIPNSPVPIIYRYIDKGYFLCICFFPHKSKDDINEKIYTICRRGSKYYFEAQYYDKILFDLTYEICEATDNLMTLKDAIKELEDYDEKYKIRKFEIISNDKSEDVNDNNKNSNNNSDNINTNNHNIFNFLELDFDYKVPY
jgi:hypothetical protein